MTELLFGTTLLAAFLGGVVALLAPCCVSVMLPAYLATGFRSRGRLIAATALFGAGVATVIIPIGLGAAALSEALNRYHVVVFSLGGAALLLGGFAMLLGWKPYLPMPGGQAPDGNGFAATYALGAFSGVASACCAPVLAGVVLLSGSTASFPAALAVSLTYVFGMVTPLMVLALLWERGNHRASRLLQGREVRLRLGPVRRILPLGNALSGAVLVAMGALSMLLALTGPSMPNSGWRLEAVAALQHAVSVTVQALAWLPGWAVLLTLTALVVVLVLRAHRAQPPPGAQTTTPVKESPVTVKATPDER